MAADHTVDYIYVVVLLMLINTVFIRSDWEHHLDHMPISMSTEKVIQHYCC